MWKIIVTNCIGRKICLNSRSQIRRRESGEYLEKNSIMHPSVCILNGHIASCSVISCIVLQHSSLLCKEIFCIAVAETNSVARSCYEFGFSTTSRRAALPACLPPAVACLIDQTNLSNAYRINLLLFNEIDECVILSSPVLETTEF